VICNGGGCLALSARNDSQDKLALIIDYVNSAHGLGLKRRDDQKVDVLQILDGKSINIKEDAVEHVFQRKDAQGRSFIQVNFSSGEKVLITETLVGFKPVERRDLDMSRLPRVVTTSDVVSVFEALEEALQDEVFNFEEIETLKKVFESVIAGGERVGFDLATERSWLNRLTILSHRIS
jgi:hypothetical protein